MLQINDRMTRLLCNFVDDRPICNIKYINIFKTYELIEKIHTKHV